MSAAYLESGQALPSGGVLESDQLRLAMQGDGNLVAFRKSDGAALWSLGRGTAGNELRMKPSGELVVIEPKTLAVTWSSKTGVPGSRLVVASDLRIEVGSEVIWILGPMTGHALPTEMRGDESMLPRDWLVSPDGKWRLDLQEDGNLVLRPGSLPPVWSVGALGVKIPAMGVMVFKEGDLRLLSPEPVNGARVAYWHSETLWDTKEHLGALGPAKVRVSDDGHMVLLNDANAVVKQWP